MNKKIDKEYLHERNLHRQGYDFERLSHTYPKLNQHIIKMEGRPDTIDFTSPEAVNALNTGLLLLHYSIKDWSVPKGFLVPAIPGRVDYIHHIADLLAVDNLRRIPRGHRVHMIDIGVGANAIYSLLAHQCYKWQILGSDINTIALENAQQIINSNGLDQSIILKAQPIAGQIFNNVICQKEYYDVSVCNPPFYSNQDEARQANKRKWAQLNKDQKGNNFGGIDEELWCEGGELQFLKNYIHESKTLNKQILWYTSLVSKEEILPSLDNEIENCGAQEIKVIEMQHGQKKSRILCWSYLTQKQRKAWAQYRWKG